MSYIHAALELSKGSWPGPEQTEGGDHHTALLKNQLSVSDFVKIQKTFEVSINLIYWRL